MKKVYTIGEALIDFIPHEIGVPIEEVVSFKKMPGGAPANVAAAVAKLGGRSSFIGQVGEDHFGYYLKDMLSKNGVDVSHVLQTNKANTALAFVALKEDGERDFVFYRKPSADMLLNKADVQGLEFSSDDILHFCSVDLIEADVKYAHIEVIRNIKEAGGTVCFDPNVRKNLWDDLDAYQKTIQQFIPYADILKVSEDELAFITGEEEETKAIRSLLAESATLLIVTRGKDGVSFYTNTDDVSVEGFKVKAVDTTGAGDSFIGAFLYHFARMEKDVTKLSVEELAEMGRFANAAAALVTTKQGAINALPDLEEIQALMD
ncbi:carbohydrate kinase family protein [Oceanobacillus polygoni]|uniref:Fructokinase n=1 Tax=Oceanobacillus polygoni TaxID=1235259 RepID=A0A9X1CKX6_9BACI|nr:carbohydrate kinase [Oceanobacillus polygoni]MBP2079602.1 fructokinase [Oceanobacillus polygoni]